MKIALAAVLVAALVSPALAQEATGTPLIRVYIDTPYFSDILADVSDATDPRAHALSLIVEGKEVGESRLVYDCDTGDYSEKVVTEWTGDAALFVDAALIAYHNLYC
jgi:hypothetical protein